MKGNSTSYRDPWPALLLALGFTATSVGTFALASALGAGLLVTELPGVAIGIIAALAVAALVAADLGLFGWHTPTWRRQTPKWFMYRFGTRTSALLWGLDAGLVVTTIRVTSLSWAALVVTFLGLVPWWVGAVYAAGFVLPELIFDLLVPRRADPSGATDPEPAWIVTPLLLLRPKLRWSGLVLLAAGGAWAALAPALGA